MNKIHSLLIASFLCWSTSYSLTKDQLFRNCINPQLEEVSTVPVSTLSGPIHLTSWQLINGTYYLAVGGFLGGGASEDLRLYKFDDDTYAIPQLIEVSTVPTSTLSGSIYSFSWQLIDGVYYLAVGGNLSDGAGEDLRLYRFDDDTYAIPQLIEVSRVPISTLSGVTDSVSWQLINGTYYLAVGGQLDDGGSEDLRLYKFDDATLPQLIKVSTVPISTLLGRVFSVSWQLINDTYYLAVGGQFFDFGGGGGEEDLRLYRFDDTYATPQLIEVSKVPISTISNLVYSVSWQLINGTYYLAVGGFFDDGASEDLRLYRFDDNTYDVPQLIEVSTVPTSTLSGTVHSATWQLINGTYYLAVGGSLTDISGSKDLRLYRFDDDTYDVPQLIEASAVPTSTLSGRAWSVSWQLINGTYYLAVGGFFGGSADEDLRLYKLSDCFVYDAPIDPYNLIIEEPTIVSNFITPGALINFEIFANPSSGTINVS